MSAFAKSSVGVRRLPRAICAITKRLPHKPLARAFAAGLNLSLRRKFPLDVLTQLEGFTFVIAIEDAGTELLFRVARGYFFSVASAVEPVLRFRACAWDYAALVAREADPDTLFFNRRLVVEGDTEIALLVKNTLDTIEIPVTRKLLARAMRRIVPLTPPPRR